MAGDRGLTVEYALVWVWVCLVLEDFLLSMGETRRAAWLIAAAYSAGNQGKWFGKFLSVLVF